MQRKPTWHSEAQALRVDGLDVPEIALRLGRTRSAVHKALNPDRASVYARRANARPGRREAQRAWYEANVRKKGGVSRRNVR